VLSMEWPDFDVSGLQTLQFIQAPFITSSSQDAGAERQYLDHKVKFYQAWGLTSRLGLMSTLTAIYGVDLESFNPAGLKVTAPTYKASTSRRHLTQQDINDIFIVPDGIGDDELDSSSLGLSRLYLAGAEAKGDLNRRINWGVACQQVFDQSETIIQSKKQSKQAFESMDDLLEDASARIDQAKDEGNFPISTL